MFGQLPPELAQVLGLDDAMFQQIQNGMNARTARRIAAYKTAGRPILQGAALKERWHRENPGDLPSPWFKWDRPDASDYCGFNTTCCECGTPVETSYEGGDVSSCSNCYWGERIDDDWFCHSCWSSNHRVDCGGCGDFCGTEGCDGCTTVFACCNKTLCNENCVQKHKVIQFEGCDHTTCGESVLQQQQTKGCPIEGCTLFHMKFAERGYQGCANCAHYEQLQLDQEKDKEKKDLLAFVKVEVDTLGREQMVGESLAKIDAMDPKYVKDLEERVKPAIAAMRKSLGMSEDEDMTDVLLLAQQIMREDKAEAEAAKTASASSSSSLEVEEPAKKKLKR